MPYALLGAAGCADNRQEINVLRNYVAAGLVKADIPPVERSYDSAPTASLGSMRGTIASPFFLKEPHV